MSEYIDKEIHELFYKKQGVSGYTINLIKQFLKEKLEEQEAELMQKVRDMDRLHIEDKEAQRKKLMLDEGEVRELLKEEIPKGRVEYSNYIKRFYEPMAEKFAKAIINHQQSQIGNNDDRN